MTTTTHTATCTTTADTASSKKEIEHNKQFAVAERITHLNTIAESDLRAAQELAWSWLQELGTRPAVEEAQAELLALLTLCEPADVDGRSDGVLLRWVDEGNLGIRGRLLFQFAKGYVAVFGSPWLGKKYAQANGRGTNTLAPSAKLLTRLIAPKYRMHKQGDLYEGFEMYTRVEDSVLAPGSKVLVLDFYPSELGNPWPVNLIHDEVVQIVPGVYLGTKTLYMNGGYQQVAWWATKNSVGM